MHMKSPRCRRNMRLVVETANPCEDVLLVVGQRTRGHKGQATHNLGTWFRCQAPVVKLLCSQTLSNPRSCRRSSSCTGKGTCSRLPYEKECEREFLTIHGCTADCPKRAQV